MKALRALLGGLAVVLLLSGCSSTTDELDSELAERAEEGIAVSLEYIAPRAGELLQQRTGLDEITREDLERVFTNDLTAVDTSTPTPPTLKNATLRAVYALNADGERAEFSFFVGSGVSGASGFVARSAARYSCGTLSGEFGSTEVSVSDVDCPPALHAKADSETELVSITETAEKFDVDVRRGE
jgi:hypothetical protein